MLSPLLLVQAGLAAATYNSLETFTNSEELGHSETCCDEVDPPLTPPHPGQCWSPGTEKSKLQFNIILHGEMGRKILVLVISKARMLCLGLKHELGNFLDYFVQDCSSSSVTQCSVS